MCRSVSELPLSHVVEARLAAQPEHCGLRTGDVRSGTDNCGRPGRAVAAPLKSFKFLLQILPQLQLLAEHAFDALAFGTP